MCAQGKAWVRRRAKRIVGGRKKKQGSLGLVATSMIGSHVDKQETPTIHARLQKNGDTTKTGYRYQGLRRKMAD
jgi:hypothetical protein